MPSCEFCGTKVSPEDFIIDDDLSKVFICGKEECSIQYSGNYPARTSLSDDICFS